MIGIDVNISRLVTDYTNNLWTGADVDFFGRVYRNNRNDGIIPEVYDQDNRYIEVLQNDNKAGTVFFDWINPTQITGTKSLATVWIHFAVNLSELYPTETANHERADEYAHADAIKWTNKSGFRVTGLVTGFDAFSQFELTEQNKDDMQPYHLFRLETEVLFNYQNC